MASVSLPASPLLDQRTSAQQLPRPQTPRSLLELEIENNYTQRGKDKDTAPPSIHSAKQSIYSISNPTRSEIPSSSTPSPSSLGRKPATSCPPSPSIAFQHSIFKPNSHIPLNPIPPPRDGEPLDSGVLQTTFSIGFCTRCDCDCGLANSPSETASCTKCQHKSNAHMPMQSEFEGVLEGVGALGLCRRSKLVETIMDKLLEHHSVVIRSTPMTGKTVLLRLVGKAILDGEYQYEPVYAQPNFGEDEVTVSKITKYFNRAKTDGLISNADYRRAKRLNRIDTVTQENRPVMWLIDEAVNLYPCCEWWDVYIKNNTSPRDYFILACVHGSAYRTFLRGNHPSQAIEIPLERRVELMPTLEQPLGMCFTDEELQETLREWIEKMGEAVSEGPKPKDIEQGVGDVLMWETGGHIGVVRLTLERLRSKDTIRNVQRLGGIWKVQNFRDALEGLVKDSSNIRGLLRDEFARQWLLPALTKRGLTYDNFKVAMGRAAMYPNGIVTEDEVDQKVFEVCHQVGLLYSQVIANKKVETTGFDGLEAKTLVKYSFPSPFHRRHLCSILNPFREPKHNDLLELCKDIISGFSLLALQDRAPGSNPECYVVPEAAYQNEFYRCAYSKQVILLSEFTNPPEERGRVDFWQPQKQWMVELVRDATPQNLKEHQSRFGPNGKYCKLGVIADFIIINFIAPGVKTRSFAEKCQGKDERLRMKTFHVVWEGTSTAKMWDYTGKHVIDTFYLS